MKRIRFLVPGLAICVALAVRLSGADVIGLDQVPPPVRQMIDQVARTYPVKKITRETASGQSIYIVELDRKNAGNSILRIAESGEILPNPPAPATVDGVAPALDPGAVPPMVTLDRLPELVRQTILAEARGREVAAIEWKNRDGRTVYEAEFRAKGRNPRIAVAIDGSVVARNDPQESLRGTRLADTPPAVRETIQREAAGRSINAIDVKDRAGALVYEAKIRDPLAGIFHLDINREGQILQDSRSNPPGSKP